MGLTPSSRAPCSSSSPKFAAAPLLALAVALAFICASAPVLAAPPVRVLVKGPPSERWVELERRVAAELRLQGFEVIEACPALDKVDLRIEARTDRPPCDVRAVLSLSRERRKAGARAVLWIWQGDALRVTQSSHPREGILGEDIDAAYAIKITGWVRAQFVDLPEADNASIARRAPAPTRDQGLAGRLPRATPREPSWWGLQLGVGLAANAPTLLPQLALGAQARLVSDLWLELESHWTLWPSQLERTDASASLWQADARMHALYDLVGFGAQGGACGAGLGAGALHLRARGQARPPRASFDTALWMPLASAKIACRAPLGGAWHGSVAASAAWAFDTIEILFGDEIVSQGGQPLITMTVGITWL